EELDRLQPPEDANAFRLPLEAAARHHELELVGRLAEETRGYPFFIQFFGALLWETTPWPSPLTTASYTSARPALLDALDRAFFDARLARTSRVERRLLLAIARHGERAPIAAIVRALGMSSGATQRMVYR